MKNLLKKIALSLSLLISMNSIPVFASSESTELQALQQDMYAEQKTEVLNIDGINYTYEYHYKNGNRAMTIKNDSNDSVDEIEYNESNSTVYVNGEATMFEKIQTKENQKISSKLTRAYYTWETKSKSSNYISWGKAITVSILIGMIATKLGNMVGVSSIRMSIGANALSILAGGAGGGTVYNTIQMYRAPLANPQYRTIWAFKASTGDYYGDYIYHW